MSYRKEFMARAIELAQRGEGWANPNPLVGCVLVREGRVIAEGYHARFGEKHAERNAIAQCLASGHDPDGAEVYVTLEPCCHHGKQPPCTDLLIHHQVGRVYVGMADPNPLVAGKGIQRLREAGIEVEVGFEQDRIAEQNKAFLTHIIQNRPFVLMKTAMTLDGKTATAAKDSRWVTGAEAREYVHHLRHQLMGIMVGIGTVLADDPMLNCRMEGVETSQPYRIVADSEARIPLDSKLVQSAGDFPLIVVHGPNADTTKLQQLRELGVETLDCTPHEVERMLAKLAQPTERRPAIDSILLEGGSDLNASFLKSGMVDEIDVMIAPKIVGGKDAPTPVGGLGIEKMSEALQLELIEACSVGNDMLMRYKPIKKIECLQELLRK